MEYTNQEREYRIYEYLKENTAVLLTVISALIAIVTFFSKLSTFITIRNRLKYWEFDVAYANLGNESDIFQVTFSIIFSFITALSAMWFSSTYDVYLAERKRYLVMRYYTDNQKKTMKELNKKQKKEKLNDVEKEFMKSTLDLRQSVKKLYVSSETRLVINCIPILFVIFINHIMFIFVNLSKNTINVIEFVSICICVQLLFISIAMIISSKLKVNKKRLKEKSKNYEFVIEKMTDNVNKEYLFEYIGKNGFQTLFKDTSIILFVNMLLISCVSFSVTGAITSSSYLLENENVQITTVDGVQYAIVFHNEKQYFLEEVDIVSSNGERRVIIYTDEQRIIESEDIIITRYNFDKISKKYKYSDTIKNT